MDIEIVNMILSLCTEQESCLFDVTMIWNSCLERNLFCSNVKYILASVRNYMEIFRISRDQHRIEFFMPFEICQNQFLDGISHKQEESCSNLHLCYDYFYTNTCHRSSNCPYPHVLNAKYHEDLLGSLINLDLDLLSQAFRVYCQLNKHLVNHNTLQLRIVSIPQLNGNSSWKITKKSLPKQEEISKKGIQICWKPQKDIQTHFIEVIFSNQGKSNGGPMQTHQIYQHAGVAQVFYQNADLADRVVLHGPVTFQSFTFIPRLLQRTIDLRHICLSNLPLEGDHIDSYIDTISKPYRNVSYEYYQNDQQMIVVEYAEDIDFARIASNIRAHPECEGLMINCIQLYLPEMIFLEYDREYTEEEISELFPKENIFHIKTYSFCSFVHFYSHQALQKSINRSFDHGIRITPIYIDIYSSHHLNDYLQRREKDFQSKSPIPSSQSSPPILEELLESISDSDADDFHDLPSEFDDDDDELVLDESVDSNGDMEFLRNAAKNLMSSLSEMEAASADTSTLDAPRSLLYGDDYIVTIKSRRFALAFLDYTQFRVEKQRNPDRFRLLAALRKARSTKKQFDHGRTNDQAIETKTNKKKRSKRQKKKRNANDEKDDEFQLTS